MTSASTPCGQLQLRCCSLLWLLCSAFVVQTAQPSKNGAASRKASPFQLVLQRPRFAGGLLTIPLDATTKILQCNKIERARHTIRLAFGPSRRCIALRAPTAADRDEWLALIRAVLNDAVSATTKSSSRRANKQHKNRTPTTAKASAKCVKPAEPIQPTKLRKPKQTRIAATPTITKSEDATAPSRPARRPTPQRVKPSSSSKTAATVNTSQSSATDHIKTLAEGYDDLARMWERFAAEQREFKVTVQSTTAERGSVVAAATC